MAMFRDAFTWVDTGAIAYPALHKKIIELTMPALVVKRLFPEFPLVAGKTATFAKEVGSRSAAITEVAEGSESVISMDSASPLLITMPLPKGYHHSEEAIKKISEAVKRQWQNPEIRAKMVIKKYREQNPFYGKHHSEEFKKTHSERMKKYWQDPEFRAKMMAKLPLFKKGQVPWNRVEVEKAEKNHRKEKPKSPYCDDIKVFYY